MIKVEKPIIVTKGIRYISDWEDFKFGNFLQNKFILDKQIPGCGFTEYCINGPENVILCSPRKMLLENKYNQHEKEVYLVRNEFDKDPGVDKDLSKIGKTRAPVFVEEVITEEQKRSTYSRIYNELYDYVIRRLDEGVEVVYEGGYKIWVPKPIKVLVTYDSYGMVQQMLKEIVRFINKPFILTYESFYTVVDEFQSILHDSRFKSSTELEFMNFLHQANKVMFVSATPLLDEYLNMLEEFDSLPYYTMDWSTEDPSRVVRPSLKVLTMKSVGTKAEEIITKYLNGDFDKAVRIVDGQPKEIISNEAVLYVNSVNHIISIIKKCGLKPDQVNILCSKTDENEKRIRRKLGKGFSIGSVPLRGEVWKMFTFCTRTVYLGADFYSYCAQSYIFSDSNSDCLAVDISDDLPQILGRQRLEENPWKNSATFYYRYTADYKKMTAEDLQKQIEAKKNATQDLLIAYESTPGASKTTLAKTYQDLARLKNYKDDYVAVNTHAGKVLKPVLNNLVLVNEIRAFRIQQIDYADRFMVFTTIHNTLTSGDLINQSVSDFFRKYRELTTFKGKLKFLCESNLSDEAIHIVLDQIGEQDNIRSYYISLGPQKLKALGYDRYHIEKELGVVTFSWNLLESEIYSEFKEGDKILLPNLKETLRTLYKSINYSATPKANDIQKWFEVKEYMSTVIVDGVKKRVRGYELLKSKKVENNVIFD